MDTRFEQLRRTWDQFGERDPLWAILSDPKKRRNRWELESFLDTGRREIDEVLAAVGCSFPNVPRTCALDFGCGVGRLSRALSAHFDRVIGIDVATSMIRRAQELNTDRRNREFKLNERGDLGIIASGSVDFVYSNLVLQHIERPYSDCYIREFVRVLSPRGLAVFQELDRPGRSVAGLLTRLIPGPVAEFYRSARFGRERIRMHAIPAEQIHLIVQGAGGRVVRQEPLDSADDRWKSNLYFVRRSGAD